MHLLQVPDMRGDRMLSEVQPARRTGDVEFIGNHCKRSQMAHFDIAHARNLSGVAPGASPPGPALRPSAGSRAARSAPIVLAGPPPGSLTRNSDSL